MPKGTTLASLAAAIPAFDPFLSGLSVVIADLHHDSRMVQPGDGFVAIPGVETDGHKYAEAAVEQGACAIIAEHPLDVAVPQLLVSDTRRALPILAATVHGYPSRELTVVGVTGTNGKTTVVHMIEAMTAAAGRTSGMVGTVSSRIAGIPVLSTRTTPEATDLQRLLAQMLDSGVDVVALEVSSHALALGRADALDFNVVAFTNLSRDHLDFHGSMEQYIATKARLFDEGRARRAVIWTDDPVGAAIASETSLPVISVGFTGESEVRGDVVASSHRHSVVDVSTSCGEMRMTIPFGGRFNVANALLAVACALEVGIDLDSVAMGLAQMPGVPGRFEVIDGGGDFTVIVDYAHTPEAVARIVKASRALTDSRVIAVLGAGGDRDRGKRSEMGVAVAMADAVVLTSDNPRSEDPEEILSSVLLGIPDSHPSVHIEQDRAAAIDLAIGDAGPGDIILILGKGHEQVQELSDRALPFDDRKIAAAAIHVRSIG